LAGVFFLENVVHWSEFPAGRVAPASFHNSAKTSQTGQEGQPRCATLRLSD
jgi:hypothetical protein